MSDYFDPQRWEILAARFVDNMLTDEQLSELLGILEKEPSLAKVLYEHMYQESLFRDLAKGNGDMPDQIDLLGEIGVHYMKIFEKNRSSVKRNNRFLPATVKKTGKLNPSKILLWSGSLIVLLLVSVSFRFYVPLLSQPNRNVSQNVAMQIKSVNVEELSSAVAVVKLASNVRTSASSDTSPKTGDVLYPGRVAFDSGLLVIEFFDGAGLVIEGPADVRFLSSNHVYCDSGRLTADVPEQAVGFRIDTPQTEIIDLGTSFQVDVSNEQAMISVIEGEIELRNTGDETKTLLQGEHALVREDGIVSRIDVAMNDFFVKPGSTMQMLEQLKQEEEKRLAAQWEQHRKWINNDPSLLIHFHFTKTNLFDRRKVRNLTETGQETPTYGLLVDCNLTRGRWQENEAVTFRRLSDRCRFHIPGEFTALTMASWLRVDGLDRLYSSILTTDGIDLGEVHWRLLSTGETELLIHYSHTDPCLQVRSPRVITSARLGEWLHLAASIDAENEQIVLYLNGEPIHREKFILTVPIRFKNAQLGNWTIDPSWDSEQPIRHLSGTMESFLFFNRALTDEEVKQLYDGYSEADNQSSPLVY